MTDIASQVSKNSLALLVPCYNAENYIEKFISHLAKLNGTFDEIIFYNDGSSDQTLEILKQTGHLYFTSSENKGPGFGRNTLFKNAKSNYVHFHDIDDEFDEDFIVAIKTAIDKENPDVIIGNADWINSNTRELVIKYRYNAEELTEDPLAYLISHPLGIINTVYRRNSLLKVNGFNEKINCWEDSDLNIRLATTDFKFYCIDKTIAYSIRHNTGISSNQNWCWSCRLEFLIKYLESFPEKYRENILNELATCALNLYYHQNKEKFRKAVKYSKMYNFKLPKTNNPIINFLKNLSINEQFLFYLQDLSLRYTTFLNKIKA